MGGMVGCVIRAKGGKEGLVGAGAVHGVGRTTVAHGMRPSSAIRKRRVPYGSSRDSAM